MPFADSAGVQIYYEEWGPSDAPALVFAHEFADNLHGWKAQTDHFSDRYRCIAFNARGYPPSTLPAEGDAYGHEQSAVDVAALLDHLGIASAHLIGCSMGAYTILWFGLTRPERVLSLSLVSGAAGSRPIGAPPPQHSDTLSLAGRVEMLGVSGFAKYVADLPQRIRLKQKQPQGWKAFIERCSAHSLQGAIATARQFQGKRPSVFTFRDRLKKMTMPVLLMVGDEDEPCIAPNLFLKEAIPNAGLMMVPNTGHAINLEEPDLFNGTLETFLDAVEKGVWRGRS